MLPNQIEGSSRVGLTFEMRPWMCRVLDRNPSDGATARATRNQGPGKLGGKAISGAGLKSIGRVGRQALQELEERNGW